MGAVEQVPGVVTLKLYGDESADETKSRVFSVAGVIGSEAEWTLAERACAARTGGRVFHAKECESEYARDPDTQKHKDNLKLYEDLTKILADSYLLGFAVALDLGSLREVLPDVPRDLPYFTCFTHVIRASATTARTFNVNPEEEDDVRLEYTFDSRSESDGTASTVYTAFRNQPEWAATDLLAARVSFDPGPSPRLEMADLLARESMKELDRKITNARPNVRRARQALDATRKFHFIERNREFCERWRDEINKAESQAMRDQYGRWLHETGRVQNGRPHDNITNRTLLLAWLDRQEAQRG
jgi:hypothetical protein